MKEYTINEIELIASNMQKYGGSFVSALGNLLTKADTDNRRRIVNTWPKYIEKYLNFEK